VVHRSLPSGNIDKEIELSIKSAESSISYIPNNSSHLVVSLYNISGWLLYSMKKASERKKIDRPDLLKVVIDSETTKAASLPSEK